MSKFVDRLNRLSRGEPQPIGFIARQTAYPKSKILVVASLAAESAESLTGRIAGADAALLRISKAPAGAETLQKLASALPDTVLGGWLQGGIDGDLEQLTRAGCDFIVFPAPTTPLTSMRDDKETGKILEVEASLGDSLLRTANQLPADAIFVAREENQTQPLTWRQLMLFQRCADLLTKPLLVAVPSEVTAAELKALWETGITAAVIEVTTGQPEDTLMKLRQEIDKLEFPPRRARRTEVLAPRPPQPVGRAARDDEDDEEDE